MYLTPAESDRLQILVAVRADQLIDGVADLVEEIRLEVLLDEGTRDG